MYNIPILNREIGEDKWSYAEYILKKYNIDYLIVQKINNWKYIIRKHHNCIKREIYYMNQLRYSM